jgi:putative membrane protein
MFDFDYFSAGALEFLIAFLAAGLFTVAFKVIYQLITPYKESTLIRQGNVAAAIVLGGALVGYVLPLFSALANTGSLAEFAAWATLAGVIQIATFTVVRTLVMRDMAARIERGEIAAAVYLLSISLAVGLLNAACMTA